MTGNSRALEFFSQFNGLMNSLSHHGHHQSLHEVVHVGLFDLADRLEPSMVLRAQLEANVFSFQRHSHPLRSWIHVVDALLGWRVGRIAVLRHSPERGLDAVNDALRKFFGPLGDRLGADPYGGGGCGNRPAEKFKGFEFIHGPAMLACLQTKYKPAYHATL